MPIHERGFCAGEIEQFSNRIREKEIHARVYFHGTANTGVSDCETIKLLESLSQKKLEEYERIIQQNNTSDVNIDMMEVLNVLVKHIDKVEVRYDTYAFHAAMYEQTLGTIISLLHNEYGWCIEDTYYTPNNTTEDLKESRKRMSEENKKNYIDAFHYLMQNYNFFHRPVYNDIDLQDIKILGNIHKGIAECNVEKLGCGGERTIFFNEFHAEIAGQMLECGLRVLLCIRYVIEGGLTHRELQQIIDRHYLTNKMEGDVLVFLQDISDFTDRGNVRQQGGRNHKRR